MNDSILGKLERVEVRQAWAHEAHHFTPWLADHLDELAEKLGVQLELEEKEMAVGPYRADIVARNSYDNSRVLIENQLETANLQHLGQILAYMAGLDAHVVVWVATDFQDVHRSAIRWLNEHTVDPFAFFAVQLSVVRIGDSPPAPVFEILERPNEWERQAQDAERAGGTSKLAQFRREFWAHYAARINDAPGLRPGYAGSNVWHRLNEVDVTLVQYLSRDSVGVYLINWGERIEEVAPRIEPYIEALRGCLDPGEEFHTHRDTMCLVKLDIDARDRANWDRMVDYLDERRRRYEEVLTAAQKS
ncbi:MAG: hypothetical protein OXU88_02150 [Gammaproteobacteria bacterium]|nr:hypothetical protein [Gammaproteobacteria bacterium]